MRRMAVLGSLLMGIACGPGLRAQSGVAGGELPPTGLGTLSQEEVSLRFGAGDIEVRFLPLDERLLRLLAPDAYVSLNGLVTSRQAALDSIAAAQGVSTAGYALVSFFALRSDARYDPDNLSLFVRNQFYRPAGILPFTGNFNARRLDVRQSATAIYVFEIPIPVYEEYQVTYGTTSTDGWREILRRVERERGRVLARAQRPARDSAP
jgi:hypothetical protein